MASRDGLSACWESPVDIRVRRLGRTDVRLPWIGMGTTGTGPFSSRDERRDRDRVAVLRAGIDLGLNFIDTAELYGGGHGEELAGRAIAGLRDRVFVASKFNPSHGDAAGIEKALEGSLRRLDTDYLDLYQEHWPNPHVPREETLGCLARLVEKGKIRHIGLSNVSLRELEEACKLVRIASVQVEYNLVERSIESDILPFCEHNGITVLAFSPLDRGRSLKDCPALDNLAAKYGCSSTRIALNWVGRSESVVVLTMTTRLDRVVDIAGAGEVGLTPAELAGLGDSTRCPVERVSPADVEIVPGARPVHLTIDDARKNVQDLIPHPAELAVNLRKYDIAKPIRVARVRDGSSPKPFRLIDEHLRFWAWVIAYGWDHPTPAYVVG